MTKVDKRHPFNRFEIDADISKFYIWRVFDYFFDQFYFLLVQIIIIV